MGRAAAAEVDLPALPAHILALPERLPEHPDAATQAYIAVIGALTPLPVTVELCGEWLWISGETKTVKEQLKAAGCRYSANKQLWYWRPADKPFRRRRGSQSTIEEIRTKYGSATVSFAH